MSDFVEEDKDSADEDNKMSKSKTTSFKSKANKTERKVLDARAKEKIKLQKKRRIAKLKRIQAQEDPVAPRSLEELAKFSKMTLGPPATETKSCHLVISAIPDDYDTASTKPFGFVSSRNVAIMCTKEWWEWNNRGCPSFDSSSQGADQDSPHACSTPSVIVARCKESKCKACVHWIVRIEKNVEDVSLIFFYSSCIHPIISILSVFFPFFVSLQIFFNLHFFLFLLIF